MLRIVVPLLPRALVKKKNEDEMFYEVKLAMRQILEISMSIQSFAALAAKRRMQVRALGGPKLALPLNFFSFWKILGEKKNADFFFFF